MSINDVPKGGLNSSKLVPLKCSCPPDCKCSDKNPSYWKHKPCQELTYITDKGDIICKNHLTKCKGYFIKDASFECDQKKPNTCYQYKSISQFLMAIAQGLQAAEFSLQVEDLIVFSTSLNTEVVKRWNS
ncbi:unnamed protein product [Paramecium sonneborni]|uniref:Uncharacterized protein n=1 Tax=Paramecium sonneborni TaxID=65129 RepID=A0A8S1RJR6_9CILI|nr:unnamed protein product [Paramecium sonneborni]